MDLGLLKPFGRRKGPIDGRQGTGVRFAEIVLQAKYGNAYRLYLAEVSVRHAKKSILRVYPVR